MSARAPKESSSLTSSKRFPLWVLLATLIHIVLAFSITTRQSGYQSPPGSEVAVEFVGAPTEQQVEATEVAEPSQNGTPSRNVAGASGTPGAGNNSLGGEGVPSESNGTQLPAYQLRPSGVPLTAEAVARQFAAMAQPGPSGPARTFGERPTLRTTQQVEAALSDDLRRRAMTKSYLSHSTPELHRRTDGSYEYRGAGVSAVIRPDGRVAFSDQGASLHADDRGLGGSFDLTDMAMQGAGQDPHAAEREWFYRETATLREQLRAQARGQLEEESLRRLRGRLIRIWGDDTQTAEARRRRIFRIWDELAEDSSADPARRVVERFIQSELPQGSESSYSAEELVALNARRHSREAFEPYRVRS